MNTRSPTKWGKVVKHKNPRKKKNDWPLACPTNSSFEFKRPCFSSSDEKQFVMLLFQNHYITVPGNERHILLNFDITFMHSAMQVAVSRKILCIHGFYNRLKIGSDRSRVPGILLFYAVSLRRQFIFDLKAITLTKNLLGKASFIANEVTFPSLV